MRSDVPPALRALLDVGGTLLRRSSTGRVLLGRTAGLIPPGGLPAPLAGLEGALLRARAEASEPLSGKTVEKALKDAWGRAPGKVLADLDLKAPVAITPLAQIHRGELDGEPVAVRVQRPGLDAAVRADLALLDALRPPLAAAFPGLDVSGVLAAIREQALDELDQEHVAGQQRAVGRALRRTEGIVVPATHGELAAPAVMVSGWLEGPTLEEAEPADPGGVARALVRAHMDAARAGLVLVDARANHVVLLESGEVGLLGAGGAVSGDRARLERQIALAATLRAAEPAGFATVAHEDLALLPDRDRAGAAHLLLRAILGDIVTGPALLDAAALAAAGDAALDRLPDVIAMVARATPEPRDLWLGRGTAQLSAVLAWLGATEDWVGLAEPR
jgi:hypothetical protein